MVSSLLAAFCHFGIVVKQLIRVRIGNSERDLSTVDESWINQEINLRRRNKQPVCLRVFIEEDSANMVLSTVDCATPGGAGRRPNFEEKKIFDLWEKLGLNQPDFHGGNLVTFLKQVKG